ncbi:MAG: TolC family protein [Blastocatellia bacterium]
MRIHGMKGMMISKKIENERIKRPARVYGLLAAVALFLTMGAVAQAQDEQPMARPIPLRTVGLEPGKVSRWTLREAIIAGLENNPDIELERANVRQAQFDVISAQGAYDPTSTHGFNYSSTNQPNTRPFSGTTDAALTSKNLNFNFGHGGLIYRSGGNYQVNFNNTRRSLNFGLFSTEYSPSLSVNITQPLFRNFRTDFNRNRIQINKKRLDLSDAVFRQRAIDIISRIQTAYWDLALAIQNEEIARDAVKLAETQLNNNKRQVEVGTLAPIDVVSAATQFETRRQQVFQAMNSVAQAENAIKALTVSGPNDDLWNARIEPTEKFDVQPLTMQLTDALKLALDNRPELKQFAIQKDINNLDIDLFKNQAKPQIDLTFGYTTFGVGGTPGISTGSVNNCSSRGLLGPLPTANGNVCAEYLSAVTNPSGQITGYRVNTDPRLFPFTSSSISLANPVADNFIGGYGRGVRNLLTNDFRQWSVGLNVAVPWRNRTAKANLGRAREETKKIELQNRRQMQNIEVEVRNAVQTVETTKMRIDASRAARVYAEKQLEGEEKKFAAGLSTTFLILTRQNELSTSRFDELRALADYNKAVAELQRVIATTLSSNSIDIKAEAPVSIK